MPDSVRVLVVDDSALMRQMISRFLTEAGMEVVATARDGQDGLEKALALNPDVITLDVQMPRMDGLQMLRELMARRPMPVVMVSSVTQHQTPAAVEALMLGAVDIVAKPGGPISLNLEDVRDELVAKVRAAARAKVQRRFTAGDEGAATGVAGATAAEAAATFRAATTGRSGAPSAATDAAVPAARETAAAEEEPAIRPEWLAAGAVLGLPDGLSLGVAPVVIGSSTGGPAALSTVLEQLPGDFPRPVIIVQHMPPGFTASLAKRLDRLSPLTVREAVEFRQPKPGEAWIAPGGMHLVFDRYGRMRLTHDPPHLGMRPAVDVTLESAVDVWGGDVVAVILTGMGMDGARGARKLKRAGGKVLAQDEQTSVVYGMPRAVTEMGLTDEICPLPEIAGALTRLVRKGR
nr:chemotaxis response regulator protein-glutamate methylesterase [Bacillota bacterium]